MCLLLELHRLLECVLILPKSQIPKVTAKRFFCSSAGKSGLALQLYQLNKESFSSLGDSKQALKNKAC